ncbi:acyl-CoA thioesterase [Peptoniphilus sp.]|uniref:acyl-CoA thioesterase n=1 Tax=Peptoniphilus sp. TaxID=1971214 RepID=UPI002A8291C2|nr:hotdog domain-containing protein [Peptoniphilus sp.]MDY3902991.1 hotdog domain-containing protein [Peptoniphilus sp.]
MLKLQNTSINSKKVSESKVVFTYGVMPTDLNTGGTMYGARLFEIADHSSGTCAIRHTRGRVATISCDSFTFLKPINLGDFLTATTFISGVGNSSVEVFTKFIKEKPMTGETELAAFCFLTFKYKGTDSGKIPAIIGETLEEKNIIEGYENRREINKIRQRNNAQIKEFLK